MIPQMRTGLIGEVDESAGAEHMETVAATLRIFMKDAIRVAGRYTIACERREVTDRDMKLALMYCARTFFQRSDNELAEDVTNERLLMEEEESDEEDDEESGEESDETEESGEEDEDLTPTDADRQLRRNVDTVAQHWCRWAPEDPVHILIKRAIDNTPVSGPELEEA